MIKNNTNKPSKQHLLTNTLNLSHSRESERLKELYEGYSELELSNLNLLRDKIQLHAIHLETKKNDTNKLLRLKDLHKDLLVNIRIILETAENDPLALKEVINSLRDKIESSQEHVEKLTGPNEVKEERNIKL